MRKIAITLAIALAVVSCKKGNDTVLKATIANASGEKVYLEEFGVSGVSVIDSAIVATDGTVSLAAPAVSEPTFYKATLLGNKEIIFVADSLECVSVTADAKATDWLGSIAFAEGSESAMMHSVVIKVADVQRDLNALGNSASMADDERTALVEKLNTEISDYKESVKKNVFENPRSMVNYYALYQQVNGYSFFDITKPDDQVLFNAVATNLKVAYPRSERVKQLCNEALQVRAAQINNQKNEELLKSAVEVSSPDLSMTDAQGNVQQLSSLRGKTVILQFWASYDEASRTYNKQLAKLYKKYKSRGLEIYQVSFDTSKVLWEDASTRDGIEWANVCDLMGEYSPALQIYNVQQIPSNYIIAPDGELIGKNLFGTRLDNKLAELFK